MTDAQLARLERLIEANQRATAAGFEQVFEAIRETNARLEQTNAKIDNGLRKTNEKIDDGLRETHEKIDDGLRETHAKIDDGLRETHAKIDDGLRETHAKIDNGLRENRALFENLERHVQGVAEATTANTNRLESLDARFTAIDQRAETIDLRVLRIEAHLENGTRPSKRKRPTKHTRTPSRRKRR